MSRRKTKQVGEVFADEGPDGGDAAAENSEIELDGAPHERVGGRPYRETV